MSTTRCEDLYAKYLAGYANGKGHQARTAPTLEAPLEEWARELGHVDGLASASLRASRDLVRWCLCYRAYERCLAGLDGSVHDEQCGPDETATVELGCHLGQSDARTGQRRSPAALAGLLRSLGN